MKNLFAAIGVLAVSVPALFVLAVAGVAWRAWWLYPAWGWFLMPLGLPVVSFWHFAALLMLVDTLRGGVDTKKNTAGTDWALVGINFLWPIAVFAILRWMR